MGERNLNTPLMKQYVQFKAQYPQAVLLMRVGDFYEAYGEDALIASKVLGIVLTKRSNGVPTSVELCGFPHRSIDTYLPKLVRAGYKVAVCDQLEDPKLAKTIVKRGITELVTPGVAYNEDILDRKENNYLVSLSFSGKSAGAAFIDISTGEFKVTEGAIEYIENLFAEFKPKEVLVEKNYIKGFTEYFGEKFYVTPMDEWCFVEDACIDKLISQFGEKALKGFGIENLNLAKIAAGAALFYLEQNQLSKTAHLNTISRIDSNNYVWLDRFTLRNLEVFGTIGGEGTSLLDIVDRTSSPMGARMLRSWIALPLKDIESIEKRYDGVGYFLKNEGTRKEIRERLEDIGDLERIIARAAAGKIAPRETVQLRRGLDNMAPIAKLTEPIVTTTASISAIINNLHIFNNLKDYIARTIVENPAAVPGKGDIIASGVDKDLDELRYIAGSGKEYLLSLQKWESERTGIPSLKIGYNNVYGYYLEVRNSNKEKVPAEWTRKQTLVSAERYITPELKEYEEKILGAEEKIIEIEQRIYSDVVAEIQKQVHIIQLCCRALAETDCLAAFAELAKTNHYCRPEVNDSLAIDIRQGRHPVLETKMKAGEEYVANDVYLNNADQQIIILTGPNMAGKSALLRQTALIVLLAQCGSYVPAKKASIGIVDKIFTRVGASDNISQGESTFMVEMIETSTILNNISKRSLILLDEIGRGTSTFDGLSIAWGIVEYLHKNQSAAKTIFATHYHELNELEKLYPRVKNFHIEIKESGNSVIFLRKLAKGGVAHSFGLHVARMAGMPYEVIEYAEKTLKGLETQQKTEKENLQLSFFQLDDPTLSAIRNKLKGTDLNNITPLQAFDLLRDMKKELGL